jgi:hypothetical protein
MKAHDYDKSLIAYCKLKGLDPNNPLTTFKFAAFLKVGIPFLVKCMFVKPNNEESLLESINDTSLQRIGALEGDYSEVLMKAIDMKDGPAARWRYITYLTTGAVCIFCHLCIVIVHDIILRRNPKWVDKF